jgi:hypothetical protein
MKYGEVSQMHRRLQRMDRGEGATEQQDKEYWDYREQWQHKLRDAMWDDEFLKRLTRPQIIQMCAWCSTFRPLEPHVVLNLIGRINELK